MEPEVGHEDSCSNERFSNTEQVVSRDVGPVDVPVAVVLVVDKGGHPACQEEDLGGNVLENPLGDVPLSQFQRHDLVGKKTKGKDNRCIVVPMAHPVLFSLVWVLDNKKKCYEVECLRPVVHEHSQQFHVNFRPEESKEWILSPHASPFQSCR